MSRKNHIDEAVADFGQAIGQIVRRVRAAAASQNFSWSEMSVMKRLATEGPATTAELARSQNMKPQSMGTIVATLEKAGIVERKAHPTDGRQFHIVLTAKGVAAQKANTEAKRTWLAQAIGQLDKGDQETLFAAGEILKRLAEK